MIKMWLKYCIVKIMQGFCTGFCNTIMKRQITNISDGVYNKRIISSIKDILMPLQLKDELYENFLTNEKISFAFVLLSSIEL